MAIAEMFGQQARASERCGVVRTVLQWASEGKAIWSGVDVITHGEDGCRRCGGCGGVGSLSQYRICDGDDGRFREIGRLGRAIGGVVEVGMIVSRHVGVGGEEGRGGRMGEKRSGKVAVDRRWSERGDISG